MKMGIQEPSRSTRFAMALGCLTIAAWMTQPSSVIAQESSLFLLPGKSPAVAAQVDPRAAGPAPAFTSETGSPIYGANQGYSRDLAAASWIQAAPQQTRVLRIHDVISVRVDEVARTTAEGRATQRKNATLEGKLKEWVQLEGFGVRKAAQAAGDPEINGQLNQQYRATSDLQTRETMAFNIASEIVDIRPNGTIVLEGHKSIASNDNRWEISLSGVCQSKDISPDNVVLSKDIIDLKIDKRETGQARDGYRRGWFTEWYNRLQPF